MATEAGPSRRLSLIEIVDEEPADLKQELNEDDLLTVPGELPVIKGDITFAEFAQRMYVSNRAWVLSNLKEWVVEEVRGKGCRQVKQVYGLEPAELAMLPSIVNPAQDGRFWVNFATCHIVISKAKGIPGDPKDKNPTGERHPRILINFAAEGPKGKEQVVTPVKGTGKDLRNSVVFVNKETKKFDQAAWDDFKKVGRVTKGKEAKGKKPAEKPRGLMHLSPHHVVYAAKPGAKDQPLTESAGKGASVSHLCDCAGCIGEADGSHVEFVSEHLFNVHRINCIGARLVVATVGGFTAIVKVDLCDHAGDDVSKCCRKVIVTELGDIESMAQELAAAATKKQKTGSA